MKAFNSILIFTTGVNRLGMPPHPDIPLGYSGWTTPVSETLVRVLLGWRNAVGLQ